MRKERIRVGHEGGMPFRHRVLVRARADGPSGVVGRLLELQTLTSA